MFYLLNAKDAKTAPAKNESVCNSGQIEIFWDGVKGTIYSHSGKCGVNSQVAEKLFVVCCSLFTIPG